MDWTWTEYKVTIPGQHPIFEKWFGTEDTAMYVRDAATIYQFIGEPYADIDGNPIPARKKRRTLKDCLQSAANRMDLENVGKKPRSIAEEFGDYSK